MNKDIESLLKLLDEVDRAELKGEIKQMLKDEKYNKVQDRNGNLITVKFD